MSRGRRARRSWGAGWLAVALGASVAVAAGPGDVAGLRADARPAGAVSEGVAHVAAPAPTAARHEASPAAARRARRRRRPSVPPPRAIVAAGESFSLPLPAGWTDAPVARPGDTVATVRHPPTGALAVVTAARGDTEGARAGQPGFFRVLEEGTLRRVPGGRRLKARTRRLGAAKLPAFDLWLRVPPPRARVIGLRFVFLRREIVTLAVETPRARTIPPAARRILEGFVPSR